MTFGKRQELFVSIAKQINPIHFVYFVFLIVITVTFVLIIRIPVPVQNWKKKILPYWYYLSSRIGFFWRGFRTTMYSLRGRCSNTFACRKNSWKENRKQFLGELQVGLSVKVSHTSHSETPLMVKGDLGVRCCGNCMISSRSWEYGPAKAIVLLAA